MCLNLRAMWDLVIGHLRFYSADYYALKDVDDKMKTYLNVNDLKLKWPD